MKWGCEKGILSADWALKIRRLKLWGFLSGCIVNISHFHEIDKEMMKKMNTLNPVE